MPNTKPNLIIVHAFAINSVILEGLIEYLKDYFNVHFIDLPGFHKQAAPLVDISFENYAHYVDEKIKELKLDKYIIAGISMGFFIIHLLKPTEKCKCIVGVTPFLGSKYLMRNRALKTFLSGFSKCVLSTRTYNRLWNFSLVNKVMNRKGQHSKERIQNFIDHLEPYTFFKTMNLILTTKKEIDLLNLPYIILLSENDRTINSPEVEKKLSGHSTSPVNIIHTSADHYPVDLSKNSVKKMLEPYMGEIMRLVGKYY